MKHPGLNRKLVVYNCNIMYIYICIFYVLTDLCFINVLFYILNEYQMLDKCCNA